MAGSLQERKEQNVVLGFHLNNIRRVGKADLRTDAACMEWKAERAHRNIGKSLQTELTPLTILTPLTFAPCYRAETRMNTEFCGGGVPNSKPHKAFRHITKSCHSQNPSSRNRIAAIHRDCDLAGSQTKIYSRPDLPIRQKQHKLKNL